MTEIIMKELIIWILITLFTLGILIFLFMFLFPASNYDLNYKDLNFDYSKINISEDSTIAAKRINWNEYMKHGFPKYVIDLVEIVNSLHHKGAVDSFGYVVVYLMYLYNMSLKEIVKVHYENN